VSEQDEPSQEEIAVDPAAAVPLERSLVGGQAVLGGLMLYGATMAFVAMYASFIIRISTAAPGRPPALDAALVSAAAALSGVLGSAFALYSSRQRFPRDPSSVNVDLAAQIWHASTLKGRLLARLRMFLSLDPPSTSWASWPLTVGIWVYAFVASAVAIT
jgi:hypothetical protein